MSYSMQTIAMRYVIHALYVFRYLLAIKTKYISNIYLVKMVFKGHIFLNILVYRYLTLAL